MNNLWPEYKLREVFKYCLKHYAREHTNSIEALFDCINSLTKNNPYHNLNQIKQLFEFINLHHVGKEGAGFSTGFYNCAHGYIPKPVMLALFLQNTIFNSKNSTAYAKESLEYYGVPELIINDVCELIETHKRLQPPLPSETYDVKLIHDLRNVRLAYDWELFKLNNLKIREEYSRLKDQDFLRIHFKLYHFLSFQKRLFSLQIFEKDFHNKAASNIYRYRCDLKLQYFPFVKDNPEEFKNYLNNEISDKSFGSNSAPNAVAMYRPRNAALPSQQINLDYKEGEIVEDSFCQVQYMIKEFAANDVRVSVHNTVLIPYYQTSNWSRIPYPVLYSPRFKKIKKIVK